MGYISNQWLKGNSQRNSKHAPVPVAIKVVEISDNYNISHDVKVTLKATDLHGGDIQLMRLTKDEVEQALPYFLNESDLANINRDDPKYISLVEALSKIGDTELMEMFRDIWVKKETKGKRVSQFSKEIGLPIELVFEQLHEAGIDKKHESDYLYDQDIAQLLEHLRQKTAHTKIIKETPEVAAVKVDTKNLLIDAIHQGKIDKEQYLLEIRQGIRDANFNELRQIEMSIQENEKKLGGMT